MTGKESVRLRQRKYALLLVLLIVALAVETFDPRGTARLLADALRTVLGVAIWFVVFRRPRERVPMAVVLVAAATFSWAHYLAPGSVEFMLSLLEQALLGLFLWCAVYAILRDLFRSPTTGAESVLGAICGYLIAGDAWARLNSVAYLLVPSSYSIDPAVIALLPDWHGRLALFTYYAFSQGLTLGYSDVTPIHAPATTLSLFAALFGVFYTAVVVAVLVGLAHPAQSADGKQ